MKLRLIRKNVIINSKLLMLLLFIVILLVVTDFAYSQIVRGRIDRSGPYGSGTYPAAYVPVTLRARGSMQRSLPVYTGVDGMYYFYNVKPGDYILEIGFHKGLPTSYWIKVLDQPYADIKPIKLTP